MLIDPAHNVIGHAQIDYPILSACQHIHVVSHELHRWIFGERHSGMVRRTRPGISRFRVRAARAPEWRAMIYIMKAKSRTTPPTDVARLTKAQAKVEHMRLALEIEAHNERYYQKDAPTVSDAAYDALRQRLE